VEKIHEPDEEGHVIIPEYKDRVKEPPHKKSGGLLHAAIPPPMFDYSILFKTCVEICNSPANFAG